MLLVGGLGVIFLLCENEILLSSVRYRKESPQLFLLIANHGIHYYLTMRELSLWNDRSIWTSIFFGIAIIGGVLILRVKKRRS
jgi:hypothetical protein